MNQEIHINALRLHCFVGVPDEERATAQDLHVDLVLYPLGDWENLEDDIEKTIDYAAVVQQIEMLAALRPRKLIETLAIEIADFLLESWPLERITVCIDKKILPQTRSVAVKVTRGIRGGGL